MNDPGRLRRPRWLRRWVRRLARHPRVVSHQAYMKLRRQLPAEQRKAAHRTVTLRRLLHRYSIERQHHRAKIADCESLKALLDPSTLAAWKATRARPPAPSGD